MNKIETTRPTGVDSGQGQSDAERWRPKTKAVRGGTMRSNFAETSEALFLTSGYVYDEAEQAEAAFKGENDRYKYTRFRNPTIAMFEERIRLLEGAEDSCATATGMAAVFASLMCQLSAGDRVVSSRAVFGSIHYIVAELLPRYGFDAVFVDGADLNQWEEALKQPTKCVILETPSNPMLDIIDIEAVARMAHAAGATVIVDNVFATPVLQQPLPMGADVVVYSTTKHIDGQGRTLGGVILGTHEFCDDHLRMFLRHTGPTMSPFNAWVLLKGLETLDLRVHRHVEHTRVIVDYLDRRGDLSRVIYPELESHPQHALATSQMSAGGSVVAFELPGGPDGEAGKEAAFKFLNALKLIDISNNLGDSKSLITHPATTTHQRLPEDERALLGITGGLVRLSVGLEDPEDIKEDLEQAFAAAG
jgi:O-succinylhomoserine sulfhydrylase